MALAESWAHHHPTRIIFGSGSLDELGALVSGNVLVVTTRGAAKRGLTSRVRNLLPGASAFEDVQTNPTVAGIEAALEASRPIRPDMIVAVGGGSALDVGKVLSLALADDRIAVRDLLIAGHAWSSATPLPCIAIPTTAGTGAEVTPFATVWETERGPKRSVAAQKLYPDVAIIDPGLTASLPWPVTLSTGLDALSQCLESICNVNATPISTALAEAGTTRVRDALATLQGEPAAQEPRAAMSAAALLSGLAISDTRTGLAHSISYPLTAHLGIPHGLACAFSLPAVVAFNAEADDGRLHRAARSLGLDRADQLGDWLQRLYAELGVWRALHEWIPDAGALAGLETEMHTPERADNNLRPVDSDAIQSIVERSVRQVIEAPR